MDTARRVCELLSDILDLKLDKDSDISMVNCAKWSSLEHINIIMSLEEEFDISFKQDDLPKLNSLSALITKVEELLNA